MESVCSIMWTHLILNFEFRIWKNLIATCILTNTHIPNATRVPSKPIEFHIFNMCLAFTSHKFIFHVILRNPRENSIQLWVLENS